MTKRAKMTPTREERAIAKYGLGGLSTPLYLEEAVLASRTLRRPQPQRTDRITDDEFEKEMLAKNEAAFCASLGLSGRCPVRYNTMTVARQQYWMNQAHLDMYWQDLISHYGLRGAHSIMKDEGDRSR